MSTNFTNYAILFLFIPLILSIGIAPILLTSANECGRVSLQVNGVNQTALDLFVKLQPKFACLSEAEYWGYGTETVPVVEALMSKAILGEMPGFAPHDQGPTSIDRSVYLAHYGCAIAWIFTRLNVPHDVATQLLANVSVRLRLFHLPEGRQLLKDLQAEVIKRLDAFYTKGAPPAQNTS